MILSKIAKARPIFFAISILTVCLDAKAVDLNPPPAKAVSCSAILSGKSGAPMFRKIVSFDFGQERRFFSGDFALILEESKGRVRVLNPEGRELYDLKYQGYYRSLFPSANGEKFIITTSREFKVIDTATGRILNSINLPEGHPTSFSSDQTLLAVGVNPRNFNHAMIMDLSSFTPRLVFSGAMNSRHGEIHRASAFSKDSNFVGFLKDASLWFYQKDGDKFKAVREEIGVPPNFNFQREFQYDFISPLNESGQFLVGYSGQNYGFQRGRIYGLGIYDVAQDAFIHQIDLNNRVLASSSDQALLVVASNQNIDIHNASDLSIIKTLSLGERDYVPDAAFSRDGKKLAFLSQRRGLVILDIQTGSVLQELPQLKGVTRGHVSFSSDGRSIIAADQSDHVWRGFVFSNLE